MAKRARKENRTQNTLCLPSIEPPPKRGRGRPRKDAASAPPLSQMERRRVNKPSRERLRSVRRTRSPSPVMTPTTPAVAAERKKSGGGEGNRYFFKMFSKDRSSQKLIIPPAYRQRISKSVGTVTLKGPSGHKWKVDLVQSSKKKYHFQTGWDIFVSDHSLGTSDMIMFRQEGIRDFSVKIFDKSNCEKESAFRANPNRPNQEEVLSPVKPVVTLRKKPTNCLAVVKKEPDDICDVIPLVYIKPEPLEITEPPKYSKWLSLTHRAEAIEDKKKRIPRIISQRRPVTEVEIDNALERARAFSSENPFLLITMRNTYVYCSFFMSIKTEFARKHLPRSNTKLTLIDPLGRSWPIQYVCFNRIGAFSGGWAEASVTNNLELSDSVVFELVEKNVFKMHIYRVIEKIAPFKRD